MKDKKVYDMRSIRDYFDVMLFYIILLFLTIILSAELKYYDRNRTGGNK